MHKKQMEDSMNPLEKLINPSSIAVVGASSNPLKMANTAFTQHYERWV